jgi:hypothetical protein
MLFKVFILLSAAGVKIRERKHPSAARDAERAAALLRQLMKVPDRAFERALGMSSAALAEYTAGLQPTARGQPQLAFNFILGPNSPGSPSGSQKKAVIGGTRYEFDNGGQSADIGFGSRRATSERKSPPTSGAEILA